MLPRAPTIPSSRRGRPKKRYAEGAVDWLEAILSIRGGRRMPLDVMRFELWWRGVPVDVEDARAYVVAELRRRLGSFGVTRAGSREPLDVADELVGDLRSKTIRNGLIRLLLRRVGYSLDALTDGLYALTLFLLGEEPVWDDTGSKAPDTHGLTPAQSLIKLFGYERAASDATSDGVRLLEGPVDIHKMLLELRELGMLDPRHVWTPIEEATAADLVQARDDAYVFSETLPVAARAIEHAYGRDFAGFGIFTILRRLAERYFRIVVLLAMLLIRKAWGGEGIEQINATLTAERERFTAYLAVIDQFPQYAKYYRADQQQQLAGAADEFVSKMRADVAAYLDANPGIRAALL